MRMVSRQSASGWHQFDRMVLGGVPHALNIARALAGFRLRVPNSPDFDASDADLAFYAPIHQAYRSNVLPRFLKVMQTLRPHPLWKSLRDSRSAQSIIVEDCSVSQLESPEAIVARLDYWLCQAAAADDQFRPLQLRLSPIFDADSRAA